MKINGFLLVVWMIFFAPVIAFAGNGSLKHNDKFTKIDNGDTVYLDLSKATISTTHIDIPIRISSNDIINAIDLSFKFNEAELTYDSLLVFNPSLLALANFNQIDRKLRITSNSIPTIPNDTVVMRIRFAINSPCRALTTSDFNSSAGYLNGDACSFKITSASANLLKADLKQQNTCSGQMSSFFDNSQITAGSTINNWLWNFGDGTTSTLQNPSHTYTNNGSYGVSLIVSSDLGCIDSVVKTVYINPVPVAKFQVINNCTSDSTFFIDSSFIAGGTIKSWLWNYGDGATDSLANVSHKYQTGGNYLVQLQIKSDSGCIGIDSMQIMITKPIAKFYSIGKCAGSPIVFLDSSTAFSNTITSWKWDFGDGNSSTTKNTTHVFNTPGTYTVSLIINTSSNCSDSISTLITINPKPAIGFLADRLSGCLPLKINLSDSTSNPVGSSYFWDFGDTDTSYAKSPTHIFSTPGKYSIKHIVINPSGCSDSLTKSNYITVFDLPKANFYSAGACEGAPINFTDSSTSSSGNINTWAWAFGDNSSSSITNPTHTYLNSGTYIVSLVISNSNNCSDTIKQNLIIDKKPIINFYSNANAGCAPLTIQFYDSSITSGVTHYFWDFGNGTSSSIKNPQNVFSSNGTFPVKLVVTTQQGCKDSLEKPSYVIVSKGPSAAFSFDPDTVSLPDSKVNFVTSSTGFATLLWNFGDSTLSTLPNPNHFFEKQGNYNVCLTIKNSGGCVDVHCDTVVVLKFSAVVIPNAFSPNGDSKNDVIRLIGGSLSNLDWRIFNEWGVEVFRTTNPNDSWDGTANGVLQPIGLYEYTLSGKQGKKEIQQHGVINLIR